MPQNFQSEVTITHIGTATAILDIDGVSFLTDPVFSPAGTEWDMGIVKLTNMDSPALQLENLPPIDAVLLSHEDHPDNLDEVGRRLLDGRRVLTTMDGAKNLAPRPGIQGLQPWETTLMTLGGKKFSITATPCQHLPGGECTGFILTTASFGISADGRPNAIYVSGDTVYTKELAKTIPKKWNVVVAVLNFGCATAPLPGGPLQITMDGEQGARLFHDIQAGILVPMHYKSWGHFRQPSQELKSVLEKEVDADRLVGSRKGKTGCIDIAAVEVLLASRSRNEY